MAASGTSVERFAGKNPSEPTIRAAAALGWLLCAWLSCDVNLILTRLKNCILCFESQRRVVSYNLVCTRLDHHHMSVFALSRCKPFTLCSASFSEGRGASPLPLSVVPASRRLCSHMTDWPFSLFCANFGR